MSMNNHVMDGSSDFKIGFIDSGTTFTFFPPRLISMLMIHFDWFCQQDPVNHCKGKRVYKGQNPSTICFMYDEAKFKKGPKDYFLSYPVLNFHVRTINNTISQIKWFPSEYLYR